MVTQTSGFLQVNLLNQATKLKNNFNMLFMYYFGVFFPPVPFFFSQDPLVNK